MWMFKADIAGCFNQLNWSKESVYLMGFHLTVGSVLTCGFGVGVTPMVWSLVGDALNRYVQVLCMCVIFTFVDDFFGAGSLQHATDAQEHVYNAIRGTLGYDGLSVKKTVFAQTTEILGFHVEFPTGTVRPKDGAIEKMFFVLFKTNIAILTVPHIRPYDTDSASHHWWPCIHRFFAECALSQPK